MFLFHRSSLFVFCAHLFWISKKLSNKEEKNAQKISKMCFAFHSKCFFSDVCALPNSRCVFHSLFLHYPLAKPSHILYVDDFVEKHLRAMRASSKIHYWPSFMPLGTWWKQLLFGVIETTRKTWCSDGAWLRLKKKTWSRVCKISSTL